MTRKLQQHTLAHVLDSDERIAQWSERHRAETALTRLVRRHLPRSIGERVHVCDSRDGVLELAAGAGAIAAAVRQRAPALRTALAADGYPFGDVRVRVQVAGSTLAGERAAKRQWDSADASPLFDLADRLPDGALKDALHRWSRRARGR